MHQTYKLNTGYDMPAVAFGTWPLKGKEAAETVFSALEVGYRHIDTAARYENEDFVGSGIRASGLNREQVFVTSKLRGSMLGADKARRAVEGSLSALGLEYLDLYLIHWPYPQLGLYVETYKALVEYMQEGLIRSVGVANFKPAHLQNVVMATGVVPAINQIELSPTRIRRETRDLHKKMGIVTAAWSPLDRGGDLLIDSTVMSIARNVGKSPAQVILRWHVEQGICPVPRSANEQRRRENIELFDFTLSHEQIDALSALDQGEGVVIDSDTDGYL